MSIIKRQSHITDNMMGRIEKFKDDVQWMGALSGGALWNGEKEWMGSIL